MQANLFFSSNLEKSVFKALVTKEHKKDQHTDNLQKETVLLASNGLVAKLCTLESKELFSSLHLIQRN